jgi:hypothetical protein
VRLHDVPGEFAQAHDIEAGGGHAHSVTLPIALVDMLRIMRNADQKIVKIKGAPHRKGRRGCALHVILILIQRLATGLGELMVRPSLAKRYASRASKPMETDVPISNGLMSPIWAVKAPVPLSEPVVVKSPAST